jgi:hypothetical protein
VVHTTSRLILLAQFKGMEPSAAWRSVDRAMDGALNRMRQRQATFNSLGELDAIPTGRYFLMADVVAFVSLGNIADFDPSGSTLETAAEQALRGLLMCQTDEFATVLLGGNLPTEKRAAFDVRFSLEHMIAGFLRALRGEKEGAHFRRLTIAETDEARFAMLKSILQDLLAASSHFVGYDVEILEETLRPSAPVAEQARFNQLFISTQSDTAGDREDNDLQFILNTWERHAGMLKSHLPRFSGRTLQPIYQLAGLPDQEFIDAGPARRDGVENIEQLKRLSAAVTELMPQDTQTSLKAHSRPDGARPRLELVTDIGSASVPWECLSLGDGGRESFPALTVGISRRFVAGGIRSMEPPPDFATLRILLVVNPTNDLPGAEREAASLIELFRKQGASVEIRILRGSEATVDALSSELNETFYHVMHFAGHSGFNRGLQADLSGLLLNDGYFTGQHVYKLRKCPAMVVFNSCESARIHRINPASSTSGDAPEVRRRDSAEGAVTIAEAFVTSGVRHFLGTFWPVEDSAATAFGAETYSCLAARKSVGEAVLSARNILFKRHSPDWANYIHYGDPESKVFPDSAL